MILLFPNLDTLRLALTSTLVPPEVTLAPARVSFDEQAKIYLETDATLTKAVSRNLDRIGVKGSKRHANESTEMITCWPQVVPVVRETHPPNIANQAPVLFELSESDDLPILASEMLRLGNDKQSYRWFAEPADTESKRVLLRVIGPPYYTLLRALDTGAAGTKGTVRAYLERSPRVWVEVGHDHPLSGQIRVADQQLLLVRSPRQWVFLDESPFQDIYDILKYELPSSPVEWLETTPPRKIAVSMRMTEGNSTDVPELWILRENAIEQLDALVRDSDERLTQRLMFAVATDSQNRQIVALRTRPSKLAPPHLSLEHAQGYKPFWKLPNLFVPAGRRIHPTLRRDAIRKLLAGDVDRIVWLSPEGKNGFSPESIPESAFRSLEDWVDYVIESEEKPIAAWIESTRFDFDQFICVDPGGPKPKSDKDDKDPKSRESDPSRTGKVATPPGKAPRAKPTPAANESNAFLPPPEVVKKPSEWKIRREELEKQFLGLEGGLDAPSRKALWPELAAASSGIPDEVEAAVCWLNSLWDADPLPAEWIGAWVRTEIPNMGLSIKAEDFDKRLAITSPGQKEARTVVASFLWLASQNPVPTWLASRLPAIQIFLEKNDGALPVRAVWLAATRLARLAGADVLGLARVRDRLLNRLLSEGLSPEKDLPAFLRYAGHKDSERMRLVREKATELHAAVRKWSEHIPQNLPYIDLMFAFGMAKLQESTAAKQLIESARKVLETPAPHSWSQHKDFEAYVTALTCNWLFQAFKYRVEQVLSGQQAGGPMPVELLSKLDQIREKGKTSGTNNPFYRAEYLINRMRYCSKLLEPQGTLHPYAVVTRQTDPLQDELTKLHAQNDINKIVSTIRSLLMNGHDGTAGSASRFLVLREALLFAPRAGEAITLEWLAMVPATVAEWGSKNSPGFTTNRLTEQGELLVRALVPAGQFGLRDLVNTLIDEFTKVTHNQKVEDRLQLVNVVGEHSLRVMKKLGMRDEIDRFYTMLHREILRGASIADLRRQHSNDPAAWTRVLRGSLNLAGGWLSLGFIDRAEAILLETRNELLSERHRRLDVTNYTMLARSYVTALGQAPSEVATTRLLELFRNMDQKRITNTTTTAQGYSLLHLNLVEDVIRAIVSDEFALGPGGRKWLDDDEYLVRRRIHADMRREREKSGL